MAEDRSESHPPPTKRLTKKPGASNGAAASLGVDVLHEIFLRLPSLATLVRAAHVCQSWRRAVSSCRAFRRRFRATYPAPQLGLYSFRAPAPAAAFPSFLPTRFAGKDEAAAVRGGDFLLTSLEDAAARGWEIHDCRGGYVLLGNGNTDDPETMCVMNPLAPRTSRRFFEFSQTDILDGHHGAPTVHRACLLLPAAADAFSSFRVVRVANDESRVRATVFSSDTREWSLYPWAHARQHPHTPLSLAVGNTSMQANGFLYWVYTNRSHLVTLDTVTMSFSVTEFPLTYIRDCSFSIGETSDGHPCFVYAANFTVTLRRGVSQDGVHKWVRDKTQPLETKLHRLLGKQVEYCNGLQVVAVRDGLAYLATVNKSYCAAGTPTWILCLSLDTMKLQDDKLFNRTDQACVHPYVMSWPSTLVGNYGYFAFEYGT